MKFSANLRSAANWASRQYGVRANVSHGPNLHVGLGSTLWAPRELVIGRDVYIGKNCTIEVDGRIGDGVLIANAVGIVGPTDHDITAVGTWIRNAPWVGDHPDRLSRPVAIESDVWIGYGAIVLGGVTVGRGAVVGAGSIVTRDVAPYDIVVGNPARPVGRRFDEDTIARHEQLLRQRTAP